ncbi:ABC transporter permease [Guptibacillus hwajinpoensis]|uniref:ABC transporter permease n=1 Tax=Guptibacillus hwajinpoensis TaxID=208199 RepID=UPI00384DE137
MIRLFQAEWYKLCKSNILVLLLLSPLLATAGGIGSTVEGDENQWYFPIVTMVLIHGQLFLPLLTGFLAAFICRYEHQNGGWKQLFALPVTRGQVFFVKYSLIALCIGVVQMLLLVGLYLVGMIKGISDPFPTIIIWKSFFGGWVACLPLIALQLWVSLAWSSFAAPLALNVVLTLPNILIANSATFGPLYPWAQPLLVMMPFNGGPDNVFYVPIETLFFVIGSSFLFFIIGGYSYFQRKAI